MAKITETLARALDRLSGGAMSRIFRGAATVDDDDPRADEYRRISSTKRDLSPMQYDRQRELSFYVWQRNPVGRRMIDIMVQFCTGDDFEVKVKIMRKGDDGPEDTERADAEQVFEKFCRDPVNNFYADLPLFAQDLLIFGEITMPASIKRLELADGTVSGDGSITLGYIDPSNVAEAVPDPENVRVIKYLKLRGKTGGEVITKDVVNVDRNPNSPTYGRMIGDVLYYRMNRVVNQTRGTGVLVECLDWLDLLDQFLFDALRGFQVRNTFFWSVMLKGATEGEIKSKQAEFLPPQIGAARLHNENVEYTAKSPELGSIDVERALIAMQTFIVGAKGYPAMWFGSGADTNKATAGEMAIPTMRMLKSVQRNIKEFIKYVVRFVCDQAVIAKQLNLADDEFVDVEITMFDFERKDASIVAAGFQQLVAALVPAIGEGLVNADVAKSTIDGLLRRMGVDVPDESVDDLKAEKDEEKREAPYKGVPPFGAPRPPAPGGAGPGNGKGKMPVFDDGEGEGDEGG